MIHEILQAAHDFRKSNGEFAETETLRLFYGPGETSHPELKHLALDLFQDHVWITQWKPVKPEALEETLRFLKQALAGRLRAIVLMDRSEIESDAVATPLFGTPRTERYPVKENGVPYLVQMGNAKHPGLFLDHAPLRRWLKTSQSGKSVLNLFAYTGSLSVAAGVGGAASVTTLDLSKPTIEWARENWKNAGLPEDRGDFLFGDVFEWLPKFSRRARAFDTILCDPPSFSRSKRGTFSTQKDSKRLHEAILPLLKKCGVLVTSINSENYSERNFLKDIEAAAQSTRCELRVLSRVDLPSTFPTGLEPGERYLKGFFLYKV